MAGASGKGVAFVMPATSTSSEEASVEMASVEVASAKSTCGSSQRSLSGVSVTEDFADEEQSAGAAGHE